MRRARRRSFEQDLARATTDEEACPPEWTDILIEVRRGAADLRELVSRETDRFAREPDVRVALARRERVASEVRARVGQVNERIRRLNLIAPLPRFQRGPLDPDDLLLPLFRTRRTRD